VATSGAGYVLGSGSIVDIAGLCYTCTGTMMVAASANTLNQVCPSFGADFAISMMIN
jgi:protoheme IX farnesyltransferase